MIDLSCAKWRKSSHSTEQGTCVELAQNIPGVAAVRDSKDPDGDALVFTPAALSKFVAKVKAGEIG